MKHLVFLIKFLLLPCFLSLPLIAGAQYSELAPRDNPEAQQRALINRIEQQETRIQTLERELYGVRQQVAAWKNVANRVPQPTSSDDTSPERGTKSPMHAYWVAEGDTLHSIARVHKVSVPDLMTLNHLSSPNIYIGTELVIPGPGDGNASIAGPAGSAPAAVSSARASGGNYTVRPGDTLAGIARQQGSTIEAISRASGLSNPDALEIGQELTIPSASSATQSEAPAAADAFSSGFAYYAVEPGDSLYAIAARFGTSEDELRKINEIASGDTIHPDQKIRVPLANYHGPLAGAD
ncbi:MAG: LysM peptidoglycan-binding domain-containing protein [Verrucomicrobiales bacterium]